MENHHDTGLTVIKTAGAWVLVALGNCTAGNIAAYLAIAYTALQIYVTIRDKILRKNHEPIR
jgi:hypothetical protein